MRILQKWAFHTPNAARRHSRRSRPKKCPPPPRYTSPAFTETTMHFDAHKPVIDDLQARILTIRDSL